MSFPLSRLRRESKLRNGSPPQLCDKAGMTLKMIINTLTKQIKIKSIKKETIKHRPSL